MEAEIRQLQLVVGDSRRREKDAREAEEKLEEYQARVRGLQQAMEERTLVAEGKIRSLQTENEALRLHLKLALESLRNPIPAFTIREEVAEDADGAESNNDKGDDVKREGHDVDVDDDDDDGYASGGTGPEEPEEMGYERHADDMHEYMSGLLKDLGMFRRKIGDDKTRFVDELSRRRPLGERTNII
jgi:hypothetical protein